MIAHDSVINWVWYVEYELVGEGEDATVKILKHDRLHWARDREQIHALGIPSSPGYEMEESPDRTVTGITIDGKWYLVENPRNVFDYGR